MQHHLPSALLDSLEGIKGFERKAFESVHEDGEQVTSVRFNERKISVEENSFLKIKSTVSWCPYGKYLAERPSFTFDPLLHGGAYYVQEASSMFLWHVLGETIDNKTEKVKVLDLCAAPGGKSTLLSSYFRDGLIVANEVIKSRASVLVENITKWGNENIVVSCNDPKDFSRLKNYFDVIVVDAPCSGSGLFRKDPDAIREWSEENVVLCSQRQRRILADIYPTLKKDGILIYSTCSYSKEENEDVLEWMTKEFEVSGLRLRMNSDWQVVETVSGNNTFGYRFYPYKTKGEGFFIAALQKKNGDDFYHSATSLSNLSKLEQKIVNDWIEKPKSLFCFKIKDNIVAIPSHWKQEIAVLQKNLYLRKAGVTIGVVKGNDMVPSHELALSFLAGSQLSRTDVSYNDAIQFLKKKELYLENITKGWSLVSYCGINIGWIKILHNRINNYYPIEWRILKD